MSDTSVFRSRTGLAIVVGIGLLVLIGLVRSVSPPEPQDGPPGSSYATHGTGTAALATLLERNGYDVARMRSPLSELSLDSTDVVVLIEAGELNPEDTTALSGFIAGGGRFVAIASDLGAIMESPPRSFATTELPATSLIQVGDFSTPVTVHPRRIWKDAGSLLPLVGNDDGVLMGVQHQDAGTVVGLADANLVGNLALADGDNALLALETMGAPNGTVWFVEYVHGFTQPTGLDALPGRWKQALLILAAAGVVWLLARGKRFGPIEESGRTLPPPRSAYVEALALTLEAGKDAEAGAILDQAITRELDRRGIGSPNTDIDTVAGVSGVAAETARAALATQASPDTLIAKAELLANLINKEQL